jgi:hypothetical protein
LEAIPNFRDVELNPKPAICGKMNQGDVTTG